MTSYSEYVVSSYTAREWPFRNSIKLNGEHGWKRYTQTMVTEGIASVMWGIMSKKKVQGHKHGECVADGCYVHGTEVKVKENWLRCISIVESGAIANYFQCNLENMLSSTWAEWNPGQMTAFDGCFISLFLKFLTAGQNMLWVWNTEYLCLKTAAPATDHVISQTFHETLYRPNSSAKVFLIHAVVNQGMTTPTSSRTAFSESPWTLSNILIAPYRDAPWNYRMSPAPLKTPRINELKYHAHHNGGKHYDESADACNPVLCYQNVTMPVYPCYDHHPDTFIHALLERQWGRNFSHTAWCSFHIIGTLSSPRASRKSLIQMKGNETPIGEKCMQNSYFDSCDMRKLYRIERVETTLVPHDKLGFNKVT